MWHDYYVDPLSTLRIILIALSLNINPVGFIVHINRDIKMDIRLICHAESPELSA